MRITLFAFASLLWVSSMAQQHEIGLVAAPIDQLGKPQIGVLYLYQLRSDRWQLRAGLHFGATRNREVRADEITVDNREFSYRIAVGGQRNMFVSPSGDHQLYLAADAYWNSTLSQADGQDYLGYFYDLGVQPILGYKYTVARPVQLFAELRADLNVNLQQYSGEGENYDRSFRFTSFDHLALGLSYWF